MQGYFKEKHRTHLDLLSIPRLWGEKNKTNTEYTGSLGYNSVFVVLLHYIYR